MNSEPERTAECWPAESTVWIRVATLEELPPGSALEIRHGSRVYALFRLGDSVMCLDGLCPHHGGHLAAGGRSGDVVTCPHVGCLRWQFDIRNGNCLQQRRVRCRTYGVRIEAGSLFVALACPDGYPSVRPESV